MEALNNKMISAEIFSGLLLIGKWDCNSVLWM